MVAHLGLRTHELLHEVIAITIGEIQPEGKKNDTKGSRKKFTKALRPSPLPLDLSGHRNFSILSFFSLKLAENGF